MSSPVGRWPWFPPRYAGMEVAPLIAELKAMGFPRATRGWKAARRNKPAHREVSPALRGDGRNISTCAGSTQRFPPRYAGMEGVGILQRIPRRCFPRATRGWKAREGCTSASFGVSPALRGDGRQQQRYRHPARGFPPRYAGMEGISNGAPGRGEGFPRATRGWKTKGRACLRGHGVSPALRGDGRRLPGPCGLDILFPPRYAGMEGQEVASWLAKPRFPRATRGWKNDGLTLICPSDVSPALRGDGRAKSLPAGAGRWFPPRYAGMEADTSPGEKGKTSFPRATRGWKGRAQVPKGLHLTMFPPRYAGMEVNMVISFPKS